MKKALALILTLALTLPLFACGGGASSLLTTGEAETQIRTTAPTVTAETGGGQHDPTGPAVGYARAVVNPPMGTPLSGYGNEALRLSKTILDDLYATCVALRDEAGETLILFNIDIAVMPEAQADSFRHVVTKATGVPEENVIFSGTHTHSGPVTTGNDSAVAVWQKTAYAAIREAALAAVADLDHVTSASVGWADGENINFTRRYFAEDGFVAPNYDSRTGNGKILAHEFEADPRVQAVRFVRENQKDVVLTNWQCHATMTGGSTKYDVSADFVGAFRKEAESALDCHFMYFQGGAGNVAPSSRLEGETLYTSKEDVGKALQKTLSAALDAAQPLSRGKVQATVQTFSGRINHETDAMVSDAQKVQNVWKQDANMSAAMVEARKYGITSPYEANAIVARAGLGETAEMKLHALSFGELAFVTAPGEMFSNTARDVMDASPFTVTFYVGYAEGHVGYVPAASSFPNKGYEVVICKFVQGTAEEIAAAQLDMLNGLHAGI